MKYYDGSKLMSYNALFSFSVGARGSGKTFWFKEYAIRDFIKNGNQFAYVRRYRDEIKFAKQTFTDDLVAAGKFEGHEFKTQGNFLMVDGKQAGLFVYLSSNVKLKSSSYPLIDKICLDEFIIDKDSHYRYLPNDVEAFLNVYETIARMRDVRAIFLSNAYTISNPYFTFFDIYPSKSGYIFKNDIVLETVSNDEFVEAKTQTRFGKIIRGSQFEKSAVFNHFILDNPELIQKRPSNASLLFNVFYKNKYYGIWLEKNKTQQRSHALYLYECKG